MVQRVTINESYIGVESPWLGDFVITDPVMYAYHTTPNALRAQQVTQLCKSRESSTISNLASYTRQAGLLNQYYGVEHFAKEQGLSPSHTRAVHIAIEGDDQTHTAFSHELELLIQRWGGPENNHEKRYPHLAEIGGTTDVLDKFGIKYTRNLKVRGYAIPEWAHATEREDLDLDRLEYIATEALLWFDHDYVDERVRDKVKNALKLENFELTPEGKLAAKDIETALVVSKLLMLFSTEHWNDPVNRAHLHLGIHGVQRTILTRRLDWMDEVDRGETRVPDAYYYGIDQDFTDALETGPGRDDAFIYLISNILNQSGMEERRRFIDYRLAEYTSFLLDDQAQNYPSEYLEPRRVDFGPRSSAVDTEVIDMTEQQKEKLAQAKIPRLDEDDENLTYVAGPLKNRFIDPLVRTGSGYARLSQLDRRYKALLEEHQYLQTLGVRVTFAFTPDYAKEFKAGMRRNDLEYEALQHNAAMTRDQERRVIELAAQRAVRLSHQAGTLVLRGEARRLLESVC
jgi:hypothetical protein